MNPFAYARPHDVAGAVGAVAADPRARFVAGGTCLVDLMKETVEQPSVLVDVTGLPLRGIAASSEGLVIGALERMSDVADAEVVRREYPVIAQALLASASPQLRNMATIGGNVVQRTRCAYFRDSAVPCNKRAPGSGCAAFGGLNRNHAVLGGSSRCICVHPSDLAVALLALGARVRTSGPAGARTIPLEQFYVLPAEHPEIETVLHHGELITALEVPHSAVARRSGYLKIRDRAAYEFALVSVAAALDVADGRIRAARLALGGVAPVPWRALAAERTLIGRVPNESAYRAAAAAALAGARGYGRNDFKIELAKRSVVRALRTLGAA